jgi:hypothetical protein
MGAWAPKGIIAVVAASVTSPAISHRSRCFGKTTEAAGIPGQAHHGASMEPYATGATPFCVLREPVAGDLPTIAGES